MAERRDVATAVAVGAGCATAVGCDADADGADGSQPSTGKTPRRRVIMRSKAAPLAMLLFLALTACAEDNPEDASGNDPTPPLTQSSTPTASSSPDGRLVRVVVDHVCTNSELMRCPERGDRPSPLEFALTVPVGWQQLEEFSNVISPDLSTPTEGPDGAALLLGWTTFQVGLNSDPCLTHAEVKQYPDGHETPDVRVGPSVDDFVDAVQKVNAFDVTRPVDAEVGGHPARFFSLEGPDDLSACDLWRPWDPGIFAQGESNHWDVWAVDVDGDRVLVLAQYFPDTPPDTVAQLGEMVGTIRFEP